MTKKNILLLLSLLVSNVSLAQIQIEPEEPYVQSADQFQAHINTIKKKPFYLGTGFYPSFHLDSSSQNKIGIGVGYRYSTILPSPWVFEEHAKLHIRHRSGLGNTATSQRGPHLVLDESTADNPAILRFRQSTIETVGDLNVLQPGLQYWDIRGFANANLAEPGWGDELLFINSAIAVPVLSLTGYSWVGINKQVPERTLHVNGDGLFQNELLSKSTVLIRGVNTSSVQFGESGSTSGFGEINYDMASDAMSFLTNNGDFGLKIMDNKVAIGGAVSFNPSASLDVHGFTSLGENAPKIKMVELSFIMPAANSVTEAFDILPVDASKILHLSIIVENDDVSPSVFFTADGFVPGARFTYSYSGTTILVTTLGQDAALSGFIGNDPAKVFITYKE
jgi:hypothetical protein